MMLSWADFAFNYKLLKIAVSHFWGPLNRPITRWFNCNATLRKDNLLLSKMKGKSIVIFGCSFVSKVQLIPSPCQTPIEALLGYS